MAKVKVRVPGSSANMGPGFDSLGLALTIYNYIEAEEKDCGLEIVINDSEAKDYLPTDEKNLVFKSMKYLYEKADAKIGSADIKIPVEETDIICDKCGSLMVIKNGRFGKAK